MLREGDRGMAVMDISRLESGKVVEHWDVLQEVPETSDDIKARCSDRAIAEEWLSWDNQSSHEADRACTMFRCVQECRRVAGHAIAILSRSQKPCTASPAVSLPSLRSHSS